MKRLFALLLPISFLTLVFLASSATAETFSFYNITNNNAGDADIGEAQLTVDVTASGDEVLFLFKNTGTEDSSISDVYFDDGSLLGIASITNGTGVSFTEVATPANLPGANNIDPNFETTAGFSADSDSPMLQINGVNPGEELGILFELQGTQTFDDVLAELADGRLRIGIHVQGFESGGSESFVNVIPEPGAMLVFMAGLLTVELTRHSKARRRASA